MKNLREALEARFGEHRVHPFEQNSEQFIDLLEIDLQLRSEIKVLMTNGLSDYQMPVSEKHAGREHVELYFCLPSYWDLSDLDNPQTNWVVSWIGRLSKYLIEKQTWFGIGHTIPCGNPIQQISATMKQKYFFFNEPVFLKEELMPLQVGDKTVHFLAITPIFEDEFDYKIGKGTFKLQQKLAKQNITELLDDYRRTSLKSKWRFFGK